MADIHKSLAKNVLALLAKKDMTAEELAGRVKVDKAHLSRVLSGKKKASLDLVQEMAHSLSVGVSDLFK